MACEWMQHLAKDCVTLVLDSAEAILDWTRLANAT
jgi:hypothetical protein